jgi:hypothetical protein
MERDQGACEFCKYRTVLADFVSLSGSTHTLWFALHIQPMNGWDLPSPHQPAFDADTTNENDRGKLIPCTWHLTWVSRSTEATTCVVMRLRHFGLDAQYLRQHPGFRYSSLNWMPCQPQLKAARLDYLVSNMTQWLHSELDNIVRRHHGATEAQESPHTLLIQGTQNLLHVALPLFQSRCDTVSVRTPLLSMRRRTGTERSGFRISLWLKAQ